IFFFFFQAEDGIRDFHVTGVQTCALPIYALARLSERFYSLPRPDSGRKSTGLGLNFVAEVAALHGGALQVGNIEGGVQACLRLQIGRASCRERGEVRGGGG